MRTQPAVSSDHRGALLGSLAMLATIAALAAAGSTADGGIGRSGVTCRFAIATHRLIVTFHIDDANGGIFRRAGRLVVEDVYGPIGCAGAEDATRFNTDRVRVRALTASVDDLEFEIDLTAGPFAPGFSDEGDGSSEIEFSVPFPSGSGSRVPIHGRWGPNRIVLGHLAHRQGANLNAAEDVDDPDVRMRGGMFFVAGGGRADVISAHGGGDGFIGPYRRLLAAFGFPGDDLLSGGPRSDYLRGGPGHDTIKGDGGRDFLAARDHTRDLVRCGRGRDVAKVDRIDRLHRCEDVFTRGRWPRSLSDRSKALEAAGLSRSRTPSGKRDVSSTSPSAHSARSWTSAFCARHWSPSPAARGSVADYPSDYPTGSACR